MAEWQSARARGSTGAAHAAASISSSSSSTPGRDMVTPLALKLQQVWLQTQINRSVPRDSNGAADAPVVASSGPVVYTSATSPVAVSAATPSSSSESGDDSWGTCVGADSTGVRPTLGEDEDAVLRFIDSMLMEDHIGQQACLDIEVGVGAFQAELAELIQTSPPAISEVSGAVNSVWSNGSPAQLRIRCEGGSPSSSTTSPSQQLASPGHNKNLKRRSPADKEKSKSGFQLINRVEFPERQGLFGLDWRRNGKTVPVVNRPPRLIVQMNEYTQLWEQIGLESTLLDRLVLCAEAVSNTDYPNAWALVEELQLAAAAEGNATQRVVYYFLHALIARMSGTGENMFSVLCKSRPSVAETLKAVQMILKYTPFLGLPHFFANKIILEAISGQRKVHIVDFGIVYGLQWPALFQQLAERREGPPQVRITGIDLPPRVQHHSGRIRETGSRLKRCAQDWGIPFKFRSIACAWETVEPATLLLKEDEVLIINCSFKQTNLFDEMVIAESPKYQWLTKIRNLSPKVFIQCLASSGFSGPIFMARFQAALVHHAAIFAAMDACISRMLPERRVIEQDKYGREIMNIIACDGVDRVERSETHQQWHARAVKAGLEILPLSQSLVEESKAFAANYKKDLTVDRDGDWLWLGWRNHIIHAYSAWRPLP